jgi:hypothetical protein
MQSYGENVNIVKHGGQEGSFQVNMLSFAEVTGKSARWTDLKDGGTALKNAEIIFDNITESMQIFSKNIPQVMDGLHDNLMLVPAAMEGAEDATMKLVRDGVLPRSQAAKFHKELTHILIETSKGRGREKATIDAIVDLQKNVLKDHPLAIEGIIEAVTTGGDGTLNQLGKMTWKEDLTAPHRSLATRTVGSMRKADSLLVTEFLNPFIRSATNFIAAAGDLVFPFKGVMDAILTRERPDLVAKAVAQSTMAYGIWTLVHSLYSDDHIVVRHDQTTEERGGLPEVTIKFGDDEIDIKSAHPQFYEGLKLVTSMVAPFANNAKALEGGYASLDQQQRTKLDLAMDGISRIAQDVLETNFRNIIFKHTEFGEGAQGDVDWGNAVDQHLQAFLASNGIGIVYDFFTNAGEKQLQYKRYVSPIDNFKSHQVPLEDKPADIPLIDAGGVPINEGWSDHKSLNLILENTIGKRVQNRKNNYQDVADKYGAVLISRLPKKHEGKELPRAFYAEFSKALQEDVNYDSRMNDIVSLGVPENMTPLGYKEHLEEISRGLHESAKKLAIQRVLTPEEQGTTKMDEVKRRFIFDD